MRLKNVDLLSNPCSEVDSSDEESDKFKEKISNKIKTVNIILNYLNLYQIN